MIAPQNIDEMKKQIKNTLYYKFKYYQLAKNIPKLERNTFFCDFCETKDKEENLLKCICCDLFYCHYFCDFSLFICDHGYFCPNCRSIFNLEL